MPTREPGAPVAVAARGAQCWQGGYDFEVCCVQREPACWDGEYNYEACCFPRAERFGPVLGDPSCWRSADAGGRSQAFLSYEQCCLTADNDCWGWGSGSAETYSFQRCCGDAEPKQAKEDPRECASGLAEPSLAFWGTSQETPWQAWDFRRLVTVTSLLVFTLPYLPGAEVGQWEGSFVLSADTGGGLRARELDRQLEVKSAGGVGVIVKLPLPPFEAVALRLGLKHWRGGPAFLYATPVGCNTTARVEEADVTVVYCRPASGVGGSDPRRTLGLMADMYGWLVLALTAEDVGACCFLLDQALRELAAQRRLGRVATVLLSPLLLGWNLQLHGLRLRGLVQLFEEQPPEALAVAGLPRVGGDGRWAWPLRRVRRQYWKLQYDAYPTGAARRLLHGRGAELCHGGDALGGSRVYRPAALEALLPGLAPPRGGAGGAAWLVNLDLEALQQGLGPRTFLCAQGSFPEEDYLQQADLTPELALRYDVEVALLHPELGIRVSCPISRRGSAYVNEAVNARGLVAPWCFRRALRQAWQRLVGWWLELSALHFAVASDGTGLALFRNTREPIPWDTDVDVHLFSEAELIVDVSDFVASDLHPTLGKLRALGFSWSSILDYSSKGAGIHICLEYADTEAPEGPVIVELDAVLKSYTAKAAFPYTTHFAGVDVRFGHDLQDSLMRKYRAAEKSTKAATPLQCREPGHNACLPNCGPGPPQRGGAAAMEDRDIYVIECEFPDRFVEIDYFM